MSVKSEWLQIRVTPEQKRRIKHLARQTDTDVSSWVLGQVLPPEPDRFQSLVARMGKPHMKRLALAELGDWLRALPPGGFSRAVARAPRVALDDETLNYLAGAIELAAARRGIDPPAWTQAARIPAQPLFGSSLSSVRLHLLTCSPVALRRRNLFVDASIDSRV